MSNPSRVLAHLLAKRASEQPKVETAAQVDNNASANTASKSEILAGSEPAKAPNDAHEASGDRTKAAPTTKTTQPEVPAQVENNEATKLKTAALAAPDLAAAQAHPGAFMAGGGLGGASLGGLGGMAIGGAAGLLRHILSKKKRSLLGDIAGGAGAGGLVGAGLGGAAGAYGAHKLMNPPGESAQAAGSNGALTGEPLEGPAGGSKQASEQPKAETEAQVPNNAPAISAAKSELVAGKAPAKAPNEKGKTDGTKGAPEAPVTKPDVKPQVENNESMKLK